MIKAIIFDYGGVLMRTEDQSPRRRWEERFCMPDWSLSNLVFDNPISLRATMGLADVDEVWQCVAERLNLKPDDLAELKTDFFAGDRLDKVLIEFIGRQRNRCHTAILSNAWLGTRQMFEKQPEITAAFDTWIISAEEGVAKPNPEIYERALYRMGVRAEEAVFVDDMPPNVVAARKLGMSALEFLTTEQTLHEMESLLGLV